MVNPIADRKSLWRTGLVEIVGLLVYVGIAELLVLTLQPVLSEGMLLPVGIVLALIPALLWLGFFYAQDRLEPEPVGYVAAVALLGGLLAAAIGQPLITSVFRAADWITRDTLTEVLGSILIIGFTQEFLKYAAVRFSIYHSDEFDQRIDGVVYGTAAGVGYALVLNVGTVLSSGGFAALDAGVIRIVITQLAQAAVGGLIGYFIARAKFDDEPAWWMPLGITLAAVINGLFTWASGEISQARIALNAGGGGYNPWPALALSAVLAGGLLGIIFSLMRRANRQPAEKARISTQDRYSMLAVVLLTLIALGLGLILRNTVEARTRSYSDANGISISYPDTWRLDTRDAADGLLRARDTNAPGFPTTFELRSVPIADQPDADALGQVANDLALTRANNLGSFKLFSIDGEQTINGLPAASSSYVFVATSGTALQESLPVVVLGEDRLVRKGKRVYVFSLHSTEANRAQALQQFNAFVASAKLP